MDPRIAHLLSHGGPRSADGSDRRYHCPFCVERGQTPDRKGTLSVHVCGGRCAKCLRAGKNLTGLYRCFRCGATGSSGHSEEDAPLQGWRDELRQAAYAQSIHADPELELPDVAPMTHDCPEYFYLLGRGVTPWQIYYYGMCRGQGRYAARVILPDLAADGSWLYWSARDITGFSKAKYMTPRTYDWRSTPRVFHLHQAGPVVRVCEGSFSAIAAGWTGIGTYGKDVSMAQVRAMKAAGVREAYCMLDGNAEHYNLALAEKLHSVDIEPHLVWLPGKSDPAEVDPGVLNGLCEDSERWSLKSDFEKRISLLG